MTFMRGEYLDREAGQREDVVPGRLLGRGSDGGIHRQPEGSGFDRVRELG